MADRNAVILLENIYEDMEFWYPYYRLQEEGYTVTVVAPEKNTEYVSKHGYPAFSDATAKEVNPDYIDVLVVPGGYAPDKLRRYPDILDLVRGVYEKGAVVAAICHAGWVLISAGITKGKRMTCVPAIKDDVINSGAHYVDEELVIDGSIVTSRTPADLPVFVQGIIEKAG